MRVYIMGYAPLGAPELSEETITKAIESADCCITLMRGWPIGAEMTAAFTVEEGDGKGLKMGHTYVCKAHELKGKIAVVEEITKR